MKRFLFTGTCVLLIVILTRCDFEDKYVNPCNGKYGSEKVVDSILRRYNFKNGLVYFSESHKDYLISYPQSCDTIHLRVSSNKTVFNYSDTFALSLAKIFFNDTANKNVKTLNIELLDIWPYAGKQVIYFNVNRNDLYKNYSHNKIDTLSEFDFKVVSDNAFTSNEEKGLQVNVRAVTDNHDFQKIAEQIKAKYASAIKLNNLSQFEIEIKIDSPSCKLCGSKTYQFFFDKRNNNL